jgi:toxin-antitoxin system PIN domain toxin
MRLPDLNVLLGAVDDTHVHHQVAKRWLQGAFSGDGGVALTWSVLLGFVRISTRPGVLAHPLSTADSLGIMQEWIAHPKARLIHPGERHADILARLLLTVGTAGNLTSDAYIAALAIENNAEVGTFDRDFKRFSGLKFQLLTA